MSTPPAPFTELRGAPVRLPRSVAAAYRRADAAGFTMSSEPTVGLLLAALAASVPPGGRILEMGTGVGVGTTWITHGLGSRTDVEVVTVEANPDSARTAQRVRWPAFVRLVNADVLAIIEELGEFDLIFADAQGGKWQGLDKTIAAITPGGQLLVDDMEPPAWTLPGQARHTREVRRTLLGDPNLVSVELHASSGMILSTRRRST